MTMQGKFPLEMRRTTSMSHFLTPHSNGQEEEEAATTRGGKVRAPKPISNCPPISPAPPSLPSYVYGLHPGNPSPPQEENQPLPPVGFLEACFFCKRRLGQSRDIFIYRGDRAFCSVECRHQQIVLDERKEKLAASATPENKPNPTNTSAHPNLPGTVPLPTGTRAAA